MFYPGLIVVLYCFTLILIFLILIILLSLTVLFLFCYVKHLGLQVYEKCYIHKDEWSSVGSNDVWIILIVTKEIMFSAFNGCSKNWEKEINTKQSKKHATKRNFPMWRKEIILPSDYCTNYNILCNFYQINAGKMSSYSPWLTLRMNHIISTHSLWGKVLIKQAYSQFLLTFRANDTIFTIFCCNLYFLRIPFDNKSHISLPPISHLCSTTIFSKKLISLPLSDCIVAFWSKSGLKIEWNIK